MNAQWNVPISDRFSSLCARVFSPANAILESEKTLGTRLWGAFLGILACSCCYIVFYTSLFPLLESM